MARQKIDQPPENWDRLFANVGQLAMITTVDSAGRVNAATFATCVRCMHIPVQIAFTADDTRHTTKNILETGEFVVNLAAFERDILEKACILGLTFASGVNELDKAGLTAVSVDAREVPTHPGVPSPLRMRSGLDQGMVQSRHDRRQCRGCVGRFRLRR